MLAEDQIRKDVKDLTNQVQRLEEKADIGADSMGEIKYGLKSVLVLLQGNELNKNDAGMIGDITDALNRIRKLENFKDRALYILIGASVSGGGLLGYFISLWSHK